MTCSMRQADVSAAMKPSPSALKLPHTFSCTPSGKLDWYFRRLMRSFHSEKKKSAIPIYHLGPRHSLASIHTCLFLLQKQRFLFAYQPLGIANMDDFIQSHDECIQISIHATCKQAKRPLESSWLRARWFAVPPGISNSGLTTRISFLPIFFVRFFFASSSLLIFHRPSTTTNDL